MHPKIVIIDGNHLVHRVWHTKSGQILTTKKGRHTGIIHGFLSSFCTIQKNLQPEYTFVVWDRKSRYRIRILDEYRKKLEREAQTSKSAADILSSTPRQYKESRYTQRSEKDHSEFQDIVLPQMSALQYILPHIGVRQFLIDGVEGDDLIGILAERLATTSQVIIVSSDKDLYQLLDEQVSLYDPIKKKSFSHSDFKNSFGIDATQYAEVKALCGDDQDDIPGVPRIGEKTATKLIQENGDIINLLKISSEAPKNPLMSTLPEYTNQIRLAYNLSYIMSSPDDLDDDQRQEFHRLFSQTSIVNWDEIRMFADCYELKKAYNDLKAVLWSTPDILSTAQTFHDLQTMWGNCTRCKLYETRTNIVWYSGPTQASIMGIGEGPGSSEDLHGSCFIGRAGKYLTQKILQPVQILRDEIHLANVVMCRPTEDGIENRAPSPEEIETCFPRLYAQIRLVNPKIIVLIGDKAFKCFFPNTGKISEWRGVWLTHPTFPGIRFIGVFHPSYLMRHRIDHSDIVKSRTDWKNIKDALDNHQ